MAKHRSKTRTLRDAIIPGGTTRLARIIKVLNGRKPHTCNSIECIYKEYKFRSHKTKTDLTLMRRYIYFICKAGYAVYEGRGKEAVVLRVKRIPSLKTLVSVEENDY